MSDDAQTLLETHAPMEGGAQLSHGPGTAAETGAAALAGAAEAVTDPPATLRARMIADLANFVPAGTNVEAVADTLLDADGGWSARPARRRGRPQHEGPAQAAHAAEGKRK